MKKVLQEFDIYAAEKKSLTGCREIFNRRNQKGGEAFANWLTDLRNLIKHCEFGPIEDSMLKDRIVWGVYDKRLKETLRSKPNLSLQEVADVCKAIETTAKQASGDEVQVDALRMQMDALRMYNRQGGPSHRGRRFRGRGGGRGRGTRRPASRLHYSVEGRVERRHNYFRGGGGRDRGRGASSARGRGGQQQQQPEGPYQCRKCGRWHNAFRCPAHGKECNACGGMNHFAAVCRNGNGDGHGKPENSDIKTIEVINGKLSATEVTQPKLQTVAEITNDCEFILDAWCVEIVSAQDVHMISVEQTKVQKVIESGESLRPRKEYTEVLRLGGIHYVRFKLDPGSEANILPTTVFSLLNKQGKIKVIPTSIKLRAYGNVLSAAVGKIIIPVETKFGSKIEQCEFLLSNVADRPILGIEACELLDLVKRVEHPTNVNSVEFTTATLPESKEDFIEKI